MTVENSHAQNRESQPEANSTPQVAQHEMGGAHGEHQLKPTIPPQFQKLFSDPPVLIGEDVQLYEGLLEEAAVALGPRDILEWLCLKSWLDDTWQSLRYYRCIGACMGIVRKNALAELLHGAIERSQPDRLKYAEKLASNWFSDPKAKEQAIDILKAMGLKEDVIDAHAFAKCADTIVKLDGLITATTVRRHAALRELDRRRAELLPPAKNAQKGVSKAGGDISV